MQSWVNIAALATMLVASAAGAQQRTFGPLPYDYLFANYALTERDAGGVEIGGSINVAERTHVFGAFQDWELGNGFDRSSFYIGAGYRWALSPNIDLAAKLAYADTEIERSGPDLEDDGLVLGGEIRAWLSERLEVSGELLLDDTIGRNLDTILEFGAQHHLNANFSVGGRLRVDDDDTTVLLGGRFYFGGSVRGAGTRGTARR